MKYIARRQVLHAALCALGAIGVFDAHAQQFVATPSATVLLGDPLHLALTGAPPRAELRVSATTMHRDFLGLRPYRAEAVFQADEQGRVDLATQAPASGSYQGADVRGLFWSMTPLAASPPAAELPAEGQVRLVAQRGSEVLATQTLVFQRSLPGVATRPAEGFPGALFASLPASLPGPARRPALILLGGSEGGSLITRSAAAFASRGYAVLALPYYSPHGWGQQGPTPPELPALPATFTDIPVDRLQRARDWLAAQPEVDARRIGVMGTSKGAEFALIAATRMPWMRAVVAVVPSDVVWEGWGYEVKPGMSSSFAWQGKPLPFVPYKGFDEEWANAAAGRPVVNRRPQDAGRAANPDRVAAARIPVEDYAGPLLVIGAHDDQVWDSGGMAEAIARARQKAGRETQALVFREGGHGLNATGWQPTTQYNAGPMQMGGTPAATARAQAEAFTATLEFLRRHLGPLPMP